MLLNLVLWYLVIVLAGWLVFPLASRLLFFLPDRGLALSRPLGLLLWGYTWWLLTSLGVLQNDSGGALSALLLVGGLSLWGLWKNGWKETAEWLGERRGLVVTTELLFLALFVFMAVVRATNPEASSTEKPMELAFINSILRSPSFPPADPWLSGYSISYYYFGYVMVALLARLSGTPGGVAFNLALASWFALSGLAAYGLLYNLLAARGRQITRGVGNIVGALFAPLFLLIVGNLEGFLEVLHAGNLFWKYGLDGNLTSGFWSWLNIQELTTPPALPFNWEPQRAGGIWWWRASRVLQDFTLNNQSREIIDEFPAFSYILGDLHPHVLAMPFVLFAAALALNMYLKLRESDAPYVPAAGHSENRLRITAWLHTPDFWLAALALGGLSFLNTWDFPISLMLFAAAVTLARLPSTGWRWKLVTTFLTAAVPLLIAGVLLYLPFYLGFSSQANGLLPSLVFFTRGTHFWIMFGGLLLPVAAWLVWQILQWRRAGVFPPVMQGMLVAGALFGGLFLLSILYGAVIFSRDSRLVSIWGAGQAGPLLGAAFTRRLVAPGMWLTLLGLLALIWALIQASHFWLAPSDGKEDAPVEYIVEVPQSLAPSIRADLFVLLLVLLGAGLVVFPEFFYLRDQFGWRMNTIFKFYYQAWVVWAIAAGYATVVLLRRTGKSWLEILSPMVLTIMLAATLVFTMKDYHIGSIYRVSGAIIAGILFLLLLNEIRRSWRAVILPLVTAILFIALLVYPYYGFGAYFENFNLQTITLDGTAYLANYAPDEMEAIRWLQSSPYGYVAEAVGGSYTGFARVSTMSGLPTVLGWPGHESQWRGGEQEKGTREADMAQLYKARRWEQASPILEKYKIRYIYVGSLERSTYHPNDSLFQQYLQPVFRNGSVTIYEVPRYNSLGGQAVQP